MSVTTGAINSNKDPVSARHYRQHMQVIITGDVSGGTCSYLAPIPNLPAGSRVTLLDGRFASSITSIAGAIQVLNTEWALLTSLTQKYITFLLATTGAQIAGGQFYPLGTQPFPSPMYLGRPAIAGPAIMCGTNDNTNAATYVFDIDLLITLPTN